KLSEYAEAEQAFTRAALLDKDFEAAELMLLHVYVRQGRLSAALSRMDALLQKNPGNSRNSALEKFRSEVVTALAKLKQSQGKERSMARGMRISLHMLGGAGTAIVALIALGSCLSLAQTSTATILGTVKDTTGALIPGASITVKHTETGLTRTAISSETGDYN